MKMLFDLRTPESVMETPTLRTTNIYNSMIFTLKLNFHTFYTFCTST